MIMKTVCVQMCCYQHLKAVSPEFLCKGNADVMCLLRSCLSRGEALISMESNCTLFLSEPFLHCVELILRIFSRAVDSRDEYLLLGLVFVSCILNNIFKSLLLTLCESSLICVTGIIDDIVDAAFDSPYLGYCHLKSLSFGRRYFFSISF